MQRGRNLAGTDEGRAEAATMGGASASALPAPIVLELRCSSWGSRWPTPAQRMHWPRARSRARHSQLLAVAVVVVLLHAAAVLAQVPTPVARCARNRTAGCARSPAPSGRAGAVQQRVHRTTCTPQMDVRLRPARHRGHHARRRLCRPQRAHLHAHRGCGQGSSRGWHARHCSLERDLRAPQCARVHRWGGWAQCRASAHQADLHRAASVKVREPLMCARRRVHPDGHVQ